MTLQIATWNLNHRAGRETYRPEAAHAVVALDADITVLTEFFPQHHEAAFLNVLEEHGLSHYSSQQAGPQKANRILITSKIPLEPVELVLPTFDVQFPSNILAVRVPSSGTTILGVRIPWYEGKEVAYVQSAWDWLESAAAPLISEPAVILGDLNVELKSPPSRGGKHFRRLLESGWVRAQPTEGASFHGSKGYTSEIDHFLTSPHVTATNPRYVMWAAEFHLAGAPGSISDHAVLSADLSQR